MIGSMPFAGGCGGSQEGTSVPYNAEADKPRLDAMREYMAKKNMGGVPGKAGKAKKLR